MHYAFLYTLLLAFLSQSSLYTMNEDTTAHKRQKITSEAAEKLTIAMVMTNLPMSGDSSLLLAIYQLPGVTLTDGMVKKDLHFHMQPRQHAAIVRVRKSGVVCYNPK
jgi:hypothetical protein